MNKITALLLSALVASAAQAQPGADPLKSDACAQALAALQSARDARSRDLQALRNAAAATCLGPAPPAQRPSRVARPPEVVPPPRIEPPQAGKPPSSPAVPAPPMAIQRPPVPVQCDANGCWADDGTHLRQVPPGVPGPGGLCTQLGGQVYCP